MGLHVGLDLGSTAIKIAVLENGALLASRATVTAPGQEEVAERLLHEALSCIDRSPDDVERLVATGYGKRLYARADRMMDEITANAVGAFHCSGGEARVVVNIGGQDMKVIFLDEGGRVADFKMNDKCAAGAGRFFEQAARILDAPLERFGDLYQAASETAELNSTCVVFAESEMVSLLARGVPRENIVKGLCHSVARRAVSLIGSSSPQSGLYLDGGPACNHGLADAMAEELLAPVGVLPMPQFTVAIGAARSTAEG
ncbi:MAG: acyl-CoA dehydratase activase [Planctomycetaceae bacterium]|nr:acyl-CoA dehydratase activase [Planctomycetaceae bacterium]